jgi:hypothetical protein
MIPQIVPTITTVSFAVFNPYMDVATLPNIAAKQIRNLRDKNLLIVTPFCGLPSEG